MDWTDSVFTRTLSCFRILFSYGIDVGILKTEWLCLDDEHSDREPERHRHDGVFPDVVDGCCRGGLHWYVT